MSSMNFFDMSSDAPRGLGASAGDGDGAFAQYLEVAESGAVAAGSSFAVYNANSPIEDRAIYSPGGGGNSDVVAAVMDGHGGFQVADYLESRLAGALRRALPPPATTTATAAAAVATPTTHSAVAPGDGPSSSSVPGGGGGGGRGAGGVNVTADMPPKVMLLGANEAVGGAVRRCFLALDSMWAASVRGAFAHGMGHVASVGSCALAVIVRPVEGPDGGGGSSSSGVSLIVANAGDARAVLGRHRNGSDSDSDSSEGNSDSSEGNSGSSWEAVALTRDHNMREPWEQERLAKAFPFEFAARQLFVCLRPGICYLKGRLQPTRAFGDLYLKDAAFNGSHADGSRGVHVEAPYQPPYLTAEPEVTITTLTASNAAPATVATKTNFNAPTPTPTPTTTTTTTTTSSNHKSADEDWRKRDFVVLATDGLWDHLSSEEAVRLVGDAEAARADRARANRASLGGKVRRLWGHLLRPLGLPGSRGGSRGGGGGGGGGDTGEGSSSSSSSPSSFSSSSSSPSSLEAGGGLVTMAPGDEARRPCAAQILRDAAIERAAADCGFTVEELRGLPPGRTRRQHHDDISVLVLFLK